MADARGFLKLTNDFPEHEKIAEVGGDAGWLHVCALAYCSRNLTDGYVKAAVVGRLSDRENPKQLARALVDAGLWHASGHECPRCPEVPPNAYLVHDYLEHQNSAAKIREVSAKRAIAGQKGGKAKAAASNTASKLLANGQQVAGRLSSKSLAEEEEEEEEKKEQEPFSSATATPPADPPPVRDDVGRICLHLADRIERNGSKRPFITKGWLDAARLMLDRDERVEADVHTAIDWCQDDEFWRGNILSMPKLRQKYDQMRLQAQRQNGATGAQQRMAQSLHVIEEMRLLDQAEANGAHIPDLLPLPPGRTA